VALSGLAAFGQDVPKVEVPVGFSFVNVHPDFTKITSFNVFGGGGEFDVNFGPYLGIKADFMGYASTTWTKTYSTPVIIPGRGTIPAGTYTTQANMFTYLFGPVLRIPLPVVKPFGEVLFGGSYTDGYANLTKQIDASGGTVAMPTQHPFTLAAGGGVDVSVSHRLAIRLGEFDYVLTRYTNPLTSTNNQNNFRYTGGVVLKF